MTGCGTGVVLICQCSGGVINARCLFSDTPLRRRSFPLSSKTVLCSVRQPSSPEDTPDVGRLESAWPSHDIPPEFDVVVFAVAPEGLALTLGTRVPSSNGAGPGYNECCILLESPLDDVHSAESENPDNPGAGCLSAARNASWLERSNAPHSNTERRRFRVTHPYHPLYQQELELVSYRQNWGEDRVWFQGSEGRLHSLPRSWTDAGGVDPFVAVAAGRSQFRVADLLELAKQIEEWKSERAERTVKGKMS
jgi:hypothetical protein